MYIVHDIAKGWKMKDFKAYMVDEVTNKQKNSEYLRVIVTSFHRRTYKIKHQKTCANVRVYVSFSLMNCVFWLKISFTFEHY